MGLKIISEEEHPSGNSFETYLNIEGFSRSKNNDEVGVADDEMHIALNYYFSKDRCDARATYKSQPVNLHSDILITVTQAEFDDIGNTSSMLYGKVKEYLEGIDRTVVDLI